jgi:hypothetical protein
MKTLISITFIIVVSVSLFSCGQSSGKKNINASGQTAEVYTCSMHTEVRSDKPGKCPKCGMELVKIEDHAVHPDSSSNTDNEIK